ncbi:MAG: hypothetical protein WAO76_09135 [Georgfuchsia sp.]
MPDNGLKLYHADQHTAGQIQEAILIDRHIKELTSARAIICRGIANKMEEAEAVVIEGQIIALKTGQFDLQFIGPAIPADSSGAQASSPSRRNPCHYPPH